MGAKQSSRNSRARRLKSLPSGATIDSVTQLTAYHKTLLQQSWKRINKRGAKNIGTMIFRMILQRNADIKRVFQQVAVIEGVFSFGLTPVQVYHHHSSIFINLLDLSVENIGNLEPVAEKCLQYGAKHVRFQRYGFKPDFWDIFGEAVTESVREWEGWRKHRETIRAWTILISFVVDRMRQGYADALRRSDSTYPESEHPNEDSTGRPQSPEKLQQMQGEDVSATGTTVAQTTTKTTVKFST